MIELLTERLSLRRLEPADSEHLWRLESDPDVMRYLGSAPSRSRADHDAKVADLLARHADTPLGLWGIRLLETDHFVGLIFLKPLEDGPEIEIGYRLLPGAWGKGFATEAGRALLRYGFDALHLDRIVGIADPDDAASRRVLTKLGLEQCGEATHYGRPVAYYALDRRQAGEAEGGTQEAVAADRF